jgi:hypothetical protein
MWKDPIIEELYQIRQEYAKQFNNDWQAIFEDLKAKERQNTTNPIASLPMQTRKGVEASLGEEVSKSV